MSRNFSLPFYIPWLVLAVLPGVSSAADIRIDHVTMERHGWRDPAAAVAQRSRAVSPAAQ
jgi:hypothetical protein